MIKDNLTEIILLIGMINISIGFFMYSKILGFVGTGAMLTSLALLIILKGGD